MYEYKTVPCPKALQVKSSKDDDAAIRSFARVMNDEAVDGWEFYSMETITVAQMGGCMTGGAGGIKTSYNMMVFRREGYDDRSAQHSKRRGYSSPDERMY